MPQWEPASKAPMEADWWLLWDDDYQEPIVVNKRGSDGTFWEGDWDRDVSATRWYPLPSPPESV